MFRQRQGYRHKWNSWTLPLSHIWGFWPQFLSQTADIWSLPCRNLGPQCKFMFWDAPVISSFFTMQYHYSFPSCIEYINLKVVWRPGVINRWNWWPIDGPKICVFLIAIDCHQLSLIVIDCHQLLSIVIDYHIFWGGKKMIWQEKYGDM